MSSKPDHKARMLWLTGILHSFTHLYQLALVPLYLLIRADFHLHSEWEATLLVTVMSLTYYMPAYLLGVLADRMSRRTLLASGLAINAIGFMTLAWSPNYTCAILSVALAGFGGSFYHPAATALVARLYPARAGKALGLVAIGASAGYFVGPIYTGWRAEMTGGWREPTLEVGIAGLIFAAIFYWLASEEHAAPPTETTKHPQKLFPTRTLWALFIATGLFFSLRDFGGAGFATLGSLFLQQAHGFNPKTTGFFVSGIFLASIGSSPMFGRLSDNGRIKWSVFLLVCSVVMVAAFPRVPERWMFLALMIYGFFMLASYPVVEAALMEAVPDAVRGRVFGLYIMMNGILGSLAHWAVGAGVQWLGPRASDPRAYYVLYGALAVTVGLSMLGLPCLHAIRKREDLATHTTHSPTIPTFADPHSMIQ